MAKSELGKSEKTILEILNDLGGTVNKTESSYPTQIITRELEIRQKLYLKGQLGGVFKSLSDKGYIRLTRINPNGRFVKIQVIKQPESEMEFTSLPEPNPGPAHSQPIEDQFFIFFALARESANFAEEWSVAGERFDFRLKLCSVFGI